MMLVFSSDGGLDVGEAVVLEGDEGGGSGSRGVDVSSGCVHSSGSSPSPSPSSSTQNLLLFALAAWRVGDGELFSSSGRLRFFCCEQGVGCESGIILGGVSKESERTRGRFGVS